MGDKEKKGKEQGGQEATTKKKDTWVECPLNQEQLDKIFQITKLRKTLTKNTFLIDVGEQKGCEKVFQWVSGRLEAKIKHKIKRDRQ